MDTDGCAADAFKIDFARLPDAIAISQLRGPSAARSLERAHRSLVNRLAYSSGQNQLSAVVDNR